MQSVDDALEHRVDDHFGMFLRQVRHPRDFLHELGLRHAAASHTVILRGHGLWALGYGPASTIRVVAAGPTAYRPLPIAHCLSPICCSGSDLPASPCRR